MEKHDSYPMSQPEQEADDPEDFRDRVGKIIERERDVLDALA